MQRKKELNAEYEYQCPGCKHADPSVGAMEADPLRMLDHQPSGGSGVDDYSVDSADAALLPDDPTSSASSGASLGTPSIPLPIPPHPIPTESQDRFRPILGGG